MCVCTSVCVCASVCVRMCVCVCVRVRVCVYKRPHRSCDRVFPQQLSDLWEHEAKRRVEVAHEQPACTQRDTEAQRHTETHRDTQRHTEAQRHRDTQRHACACMRISSGKQSGPQKKTQSL